MLFLILGFFSPRLSADEMVFRGVYQGKDLYIMNPMLERGLDYCVTKVLINDMVYDEVINSSAFRISFEAVGLEFGEAYEIVLKHKSNCKPTLVNPEVLKPLSTFKIVDIKLGYNDLLRFTTDNESGKLKFIVEEFRWERWMKAGEVDGRGGPGQNSYSVRVYPYSGENQFRIYQIDHMMKKNISDTIVINYEKDPVDVLSKMKRVKNKIEFSAETKYVIINQYGEVVVDGFGSEIDVSELSKGDYFLNFENEYRSFKKK